ncbi:hypothetical protein [Pseudomonas sp. EA_65y_Pfl2_P74]|uniref:hypothetical protein n=1 Tax=Pseudomonas sp. EA_65y_Pfl2_P74 TaxID=3088694 RepID=UPI0030D88A8F
MASLKSKLRKGLMSSRGFRANTRNNLWLVYSNKLNTDVSLASNRELIYWLAKLEVDPLIECFSFGYQASLKLDGAQDKYSSVEVIKVDYSDRPFEFHHLSSGASETKCFRIPFLSEVGEEVEVTYVQVHEGYLAAQATFCVRLLKVVSFVAQIRDGTWKAETENISNVVRSFKNGTVQDLIELCHGIDVMIIIGICCRMVLSGQLILDLELNEFGRKSKWRLP